MSLRIPLSRTSVVVVAQCECVVYVLGSENIYKVIVVIRVCSSVVCSDAKTIFRLYQLLHRQALRGVGGLIIVLFPEIMLHDIIVLTLK